MPCDNHKAYNLLCKDICGQHNAHKTVAVMCCNYLKQYNAIVLPAIYRRSLHPP